MALMSSEGIYRQQLLTKSRQAGRLVRNGPWKGNRRMRLTRMTFSGTSESRRKDGSTLELIWQLSRIILPKFWSIHFLTTLSQMIVILLVVVAAPKMTIKMTKIGKDALVVKSWKLSISELLKNLSKDSREFPVVLTYTNMISHTRMRMEIWSDPHPKWPYHRPRWSFPHSSDMPRKSPTLNKWSKNCFKSNYWGPSARPSMRRFVRRVCARSSRRLIRSSWKRSWMNCSRR